MRIGFREWVALAMLAAAIVMALPFAADGPNGDVPGRLVEVTTPATIEATPTPPPTATPAPPTPTPTNIDARAAATRWTVFVEEDAGNGLYQAAAQWTTETIDFSYDSYPFPDVADDRWRLSVVGLVELPEGERYALRLVADGEVRVFVDGELVISSVDGTAGPREVVAEFRHRPGLAEVRIEVRDVGGPLLLRLVGGTP